MADFTFSCPHCAQHIQCDTVYAGTQINCPACQQLIVVPPPQVTSTAPAAPVRPKASAKSPKPAIWRNITIAGLSALALAAGVFAVIHFGFGDSTQTVWKEWSTLDGNKSQWSFENGEITGHSTTGDSILASRKAYGDVTFSATVQTDNREASLAIRMRDGGNGYIVAFVPTGTPVTGKNGYVCLKKRTGGKGEDLMFYRKMDSVGQTANLKVIAHGSSIDVWLNETKILHDNDSTFSSGKIGFRIVGGPDLPCDGVFSNVKFH